MPANRPLPARPGHSLARAALAMAALAAAPIESPAQNPDPAAPLTVVRRALDRGRGPWQTWQVDYTLRNEGPTTLVARPAEVSAELRGWVSNSRVPAHATPRTSEQTVSGGSGLSSFAEVIPSADPDKRCRERAVLQVWAGDAAVPPDPVAKAGVRLVAAEEQPTLEIPPGGLVRVRLRLEHEHHLYGPYDPLLGPRALELRLGPARFRDTLALDQPLPAPAPDPAWSPNASADRLDTRRFASAPDSLHLEAHVAGNQSYRFPERPVRYGTKYRLSYWYFVAPGTEGTCTARLAQYRNTSTWRSLNEGEIEQSLATVGRWARVERTFRAEPDATTAILEFRIRADEVGELWIDDVRLEPVGEAPAGP